MSKKILIVEDEEALLDMYKLKFTQEGYQVIIAGDGLSGLELARKEQPDLILLDLILPKVDGYQVLGELKKDDRTKKIKVYIISNLGQNGEINKSFNSGADGYLIKANLTPSQLIEKVNQIFNGKAVGVKRASVVPAKEAASKPTETEIKKTRLPNAFKTGGQDNIKVLLIEDEEVIVNMYKLRFIKAGFEVEVARNGAWGLKLASQKPFDIIIMDMVMPAMNGYEAIKRLKTDNKTKDIPVIVISNSAQDTDIERAKQCGAANYLLKSQITPARLVREVEKFVKK